MDATDPTDAAPEPDHASDADQRGRLVLAPRVVERIAEAAAREVSVTGSGRTGLTDLVRGRLPRASAVVAGSTSRVRVQVASAWPDPLPRVAAAVRDHVARRVTDLAGLDVTAVDVTIAEIVHDHGTRRSSPHDERSTT